MLMRDLFYETNITLHGARGHVTFNVFLADTKRHLHVSHPLRRFLDANMIDSYANAIQTISTATQNLSATETAFYNQWHTEEFVEGYREKFQFQKDMIPSPNLNMGTLPPRVTYLMEISDALYPVCRDLVEKIYGTDDNLLKDAELFEWWRVLYEEIPGVPKLEDMNMDILAKILQRFCLTIFWHDIFHMQHTDRGLIREIFIPNNSTTTVVNALQNKFIVEVNDILNETLKFQKNIAERFATFWKNLYTEEKYQSVMDKGRKKIDKIHKKYNLDEEYITRHTIGH